MKSELQALVDECAEELKDIESRLAQMSPFDKARKYLTHYALIRAAGVAEYVYRSIVTDYFSKLSDSRIDTFLDGAVRKVFSVKKDWGFPKLLETEVPLHTRTDIRS